MDDARNFALKTPGRPFAAGNPGKPKGARHRATRMLEAILLDDARDVARAVVEAAKRGDMQAAKMILDRACPVPKSRKVKLDLPEVSTAADVLRAQATVVDAMARAKITPDEAATVAGVLDAKRRAIETVEIEARLSKLEQDRQD